MWLATAEPLARAPYIVLFNLKPLNEDCNWQVYMFRTDAERTRLYNRMPVMQLDIQLCNQVSRCITYQGTNSYPVVQLDSLKTTQLYKWTVWKLPGCTTRWSDSYLVV